LKGIAPNQVVTNSRTQVVEWFSQGNTKPMSFLDFVIIMALWFFEAWATYKAVFEDKTKTSERPLRVECCLSNKTQIFSNDWAA